jgi:hypothetical protein
LNYSIGLERISLAVEFHKKFEEYLDNVSKATSEPSKTFLFLKFVSDVFGGIKADYAEKLLPELEKYIKVKHGAVAVTGRVDVFLGNLIIEFESDLTSTLQEAENQLKRYIAILWSEKKHRVEWLALASDGMNFRVYRPRTPIALGERVTSEDVLLEEVDKCNLKVMHRKQGAEWVYVWLDRYLLYRTLVPPTTEEFVKDFGLLSSSYKISDSILKSAWNEIKGTGVETLYDEWAKYLEVVYGTRVQSEDLFIRHTYLATLAKLMAFMFYSGLALPSSDEVESVVSGEVFRQWGIYGFLEEDFFSWILKEKIRDQGLKFVMDLLGRLRRYDLTKLEEDVLKGLYQELVDPKERHDLGEYYTPDWLAESIAKENIEAHPEVSILDPACGSGTFLVATVRIKRKKLDNKSPEQVLNHILGNVVGIDIHPLAVITAKVNYLLALGDLIRKHRRGRITIPVYMGDSIRLPKEVETLEEGVVAYIVEGPKDKRFFIPRIIAENAEAHDEVIQVIRDYVKNVKKLEKEQFINFLELRAQIFAKILEKKPKIQNAVFSSLFKTASSMWELEKDERDTVWAFILMNIFKPLFFFLRDKKFDLIIGNPPWLSYRYVRSTDYQEELKKLIVEEYKLLPSSKAELITHMELATLFFSRTADLYLKEDGIVSFVMPRSIFSADQHDNFRNGAFTPRLGFLKIFDLLKVKPLFNVPSSVFIARKDMKTKYPVKTIVYSGELPSKNEGLREAEKCLTIRETKLKLGAIGERSFLTEKVLRIPKMQSDYYKKIYQGATIVPRQIWLVDITSHPKFGINLQMPYVKTSERAEKLAKEAYKNLSFEGVVEPQFLFSLLTGSEIVPFGTLSPPTIVAPIEPTNTKYRLINSEEAERRGFLNLKKWLNRAELEWKRRREEKAEKMTIYQRLDRQMGLSRQNPKAKYKVIYNTSGTYLASAIVENKRPTVKVNSTKFQLKGILIDCTLYSYETNSKDEAFYIASILNSSIIDEVIKPAQARGLFGPRHIHKKPFEISIPKFDSRNNIHRELSTLGKICTSEVEKILPNLAKEVDSIGWIRKKINVTLKQHLDQIDDLVLKLFEANENRGTLTIFT